MWALITRSAVTNISSAEQKRTLLGEDIVQMTVESVIPLTFSIGDSTKVFGRTYKLNALPTVTKKGKRSYSYYLTWEGNQYDLLTVQYLLDIDETESLYSDFSLTGDLRLFMQLLIHNLRRKYGERYILGTCPDTNTITDTFANENCLAVLQRLCGEDFYNKEFNLVEDESGTIIINVSDTVGQILGQTYYYGKGKGAYMLKRQTVSNKNILTRLYAFGSQKNLKSSYRGYSQRLKLPGIVRSFIDDETAISAYGLIEGTKIFEDIFPHRTGTVTSVGSTIFSFIDTGMDFDLNARDESDNTLYLIPESSAKIHFNSGTLAGYEFEITAYNHQLREFTIKQITDERGQKFPDSETMAFRIDVGDQYVILDIMMPQAYIDAAETELLTTAHTYLEQNCQPRVQYSLELDHMFLKDRYAGQGIVNVYDLGDSVQITDTDIGVNKILRIRSFKRDLINVYKYTIDLDDTLEQTLMQRIIASTLETEKALALNNLKDPARAMRSWKTSQELLGLIFDPDGYFNGEKIKPETIETIMLLVGVKSQQFSLSASIDPNYQGNPQSVNITAGLLSHFGIDTNIRIWNISAGQQTLTETGPLYIYAKCSKIDVSGSILFSNAQIRLMDDPNYYHFLLGVLHAVVDGVRWISLTYGATVINGKFVRTGRISSQDGLTYFDLDSGEISGRIKFSSGNYDNEIEANISTAVAAANSAQEAAVNAASLAVTKKRHFTSQPIPPYNIGDLWSNGINLYRCIRERSSGNYVSGDWQLATSYDRTQTIIDGGIITTGRIEIGGGMLGSGNSGIDGSVSSTPGQDIRFWAGASYNNRNFAPFRVTNNGDIVAQGIIEFGTKPIGGQTLGMMNLAFKGNDIWENTFNDSGSYVAINRKGYLGSNEFFRNLRIYDGKDHIMAEFSGQLRKLLMDEIKIPTNNHRSVNGSTNINCPATEGDMAGMSITFQPCGGHFLVLFEAPFWAYSQSQTLNLLVNIDGINVKTSYSMIYSDIVTISTHYLATVTPGAEVTIKIRWYGGSVRQYGSTHGTRNLTVIDLM